jgi:hypothetical protein
MISSNFIFFRAEASEHRLRELNPYVSIDTLTSELNESTDLQYLKQFQVNLPSQK